MSNAKVEQFKAGVAEIQAEASRKVAQLKRNIGDQDSDGDVDLADVKIRIEARTGHIGPRECAFMAAGGLGMFIMMKVVPPVLHLFGLGG